MFYPPKENVEKGVPGQSKQLPGSQLFKSLKELRTRETLSWHTLGSDVHCLIMPCHIWHNIISSGSGCFQSLLWGKESYILRPLSLK